MTSEPASGKSCGTCAVCCHSLRVVELSKPAGVMCGHCTGTGCAIHATRFEICRTFYCGWRIVKQLDDSWRPDRSGVIIITMEADKLPEEYRPQKNGLEFIVLGGEKAIMRPGFAEYVSTLVSRNVAVYLSADSSKTLVNDHLRKLVAEKNKAGVIGTLLHIYRQHVQTRIPDPGAPPLPWVPMV
jgi:hypothetical protein